MEKNHTSVINIAVAENKKKQSIPVTREKEHKPRKLLWLSVTLIFVAVAVVGGTLYFWVVGSQSIPITTAQNYYPSIIQALAAKTFPADPKNLSDSLDPAVANTSSSPVGSIINLIPIGPGGVAIGSSTDMFSSIGVSLPMQIARSLDGTYMLGTIVSNPNHPFIILGLSSFENAFAGMLAWERTMRHDMAGFIQVDHPDEPSIPLSAETFTDKTIENQDVREILNASSTPIFLYAFIGTSKLVITTDPDTMATVITDLNTTNTTK